MGQYYRIYAENNEGAKVFVSYDYDNGAKLMEHSYFGNKFVGAICSTLFENPHRVWWVGDYADEDGDFAEDRQNIYLDTWSAEKKGIKIVKKTEEFDFSDGLFLINHDKEEYLDLTDCSNHNKDKYGFRIHPLPLLTAVGNGRGGGDFRGNDEFVGYWAGDLLEISASAPKHYADCTEIGYFKEG